MRAPTAPSTLGATRRATLTASPTTTSLGRLRAQLRAGRRRRRRPAPPRHRRDRRHRTPPRHPAGSSGRAAPVGDLPVDPQQARRRRPRRPSRPGPRRGHREPARHRRCPRPRLPPQRHRLLLLSVRLRWYPYWETTRSAPAARTELRQLARTKGTARAGDGQDGASRRKRGELVSSSGGVEGADARVDAGRSGAAQDEQAVGATGRAAASFSPERPASDAPRAGSGHVPVESGVVAEFHRQAFGSHGGPVELRETHLARLARQRPAVA